MLRADGMISRAQTAGGKPRHITCNLRPIRGQGLPISTIIIAGLGLIVLVILSVMVAQKVGVFGKGTREVSEQQCSSPNQVRPLGTDCELVLGSFKNVGPNDICCKG